MRGSNGWIAACVVLGLCGVSCGGGDDDGSSGEGEGGGGPGLGAAGRSSASNEYHCLYEHEYEVPIRDKKAFEITTSCAPEVLDTAADWEAPVERPTHVSDLKFYEALGCTVVEDSVDVTDLSCTREGSLSCVVGAETYSIDYTIWIGGAVIIDGKFHIVGPTDCDVDLIFSKQ